MQYLRLFTYAFAKTQPEKKSDLNGIRGPFLYLIEIIM